ncbi:helix-turn-helix transcriptional regulator [Bacillus megaterium]|nr:helix-turn-helix transcriptional regulator [Priestia megaterium]
MEVGEYLKQIRRQKYLTLAQVAEEIGVTANYISLIERGKNTPNDELIEKIAKFYEIDEDGLFERFGKVSTSVMEEIKKYGYLRKAILQIKNRKDIKESEKEELYRRLFIWHDKAMYEEDE